MKDDLLLWQVDKVTDAPDGLEHLRRLVLGLAIRGRLLPQRQNDGSVGHLLERIDDRKEALYEAGEIRKPRTLRSIDEEPFGIPNSWSWVRLGRVAKIVGGGTPKTKVTDYWADGSGIPWVTPADLRDLPTKFVSRGRRDITQKGLDKSSAQLLPTGSVLFSSRAPIGYVAIAKNPLATNQGFKSCVLYEEGMSEYLYWVLRALAPEIDKKAPGTTFREVSGSIVAQIQIPLPPLSEQRRIAEKVDQLFQLCDEVESARSAHQLKREYTLRSVLHNLVSKNGRDSRAERAEGLLLNNFEGFFKRPMDLHPLRRSLLKLAVRGRLVPQLASEGTAHSLLECLPAASESDRDDKVPNSEGTFAVPQGWVWAPFSQIADHRLGKMLDRSKNEGSPRPYLRNSNVQWLRFDLSDVKRMRLRQDELEKYRVEPGDLLICEGGEPGRCAVWEDQSQEIYFQKALHRARPLPGISVEYLQWVLFEAAESGRLENYFTGSTIKHLPGVSLASFPVPVPPPQEQIRIVQRLATLWALVGEFEDSLTTTRSKASRLAASTVKAILNQYERVHG